jgi:hypothetical protein
MEREGITDEGQATDALLDAFEAQTAVAVLPLGPKAISLAPVA